MPHPPRRIDIVSFIRTVASHRLLFITALVMFGVAGIAISRSSAFKASFSPPAMPGTSGQESLSGVRSKGSVELLRFAGLRRTARPSSPTSMLAPTVAASKTDLLFTDVDGDLQADPGDTLKYTVSISAGGEDATGVTFTDTVDPNTAFVAGSLTATPVAVDHSYVATGNVRISVPAPGVLGNDFAGVPAATITAPSTSANGGDVTVNANGSFTYNPPAGFEGTDTFSYTLTNASGSNPATVTITVSGMIWFINNNPGACASSCDGRLTNPFNSLASFQAVNNGAGNNPAANDNIFVYESSINYVGPVTLLNGQRFIGQDATASLSSITGLTPPSYSDPLPATNSGNATIVNTTSAVTAITVASDNTLTGFTGGDAVTDITGIGFGTLTVSDVSLNGLGQALDLSTGTLAAAFIDISSTNSATTGLTLTSVGGSLTSGSTTVTNAAGVGVNVNTSSGSLSFGDTTSSGSGGSGVSLLTNTGTITFGALNISPDANQRGLSATDNSNTITSTSGAISTTGAIAVEITRSSLTTPLAIALTSVSATSDANGIFLRNTSGSFAVNGDGTNVSVGGNSSGGTISGMSGADGAIAGNGVYLDNASNVTLRRMTINGANQNHGIRGVNGNTGFALEYSTVSGSNGNSAAFDEGSVNFDNLSGAAAITSSVIEGGFEDNLNVVNTSGTLNRLVITGSTFGFNSTASGNNNILIESQNTGTTLNFTLQSSIIKGARADWLNATNNSNSTMDAVVGGSTPALGNIFDNLGANAHPGAAPGSNRVVIGAVGVQLLDIRNNTMKGSKGEAIRVRSTAAGVITGAMDARVRNNTIGIAATANSGSSESNGIFVLGDGGSDMDIAVTDNQIFQYNNHGILLQFGDELNDGAIYNVTVTGNTVNSPGNINSEFNGIQLNHGTVSATDNFTGCIDIGGAGALANNIAGSGNGVTPPNNQEFRLRQRQTTTVRLPGYGGSNLDTTAVIAYIQGRNVVTAGNGAASVQGATGFVGGAACTSPSVSAALYTESKKGASINYSETLPDGASESVHTLNAAGGEARDGIDGQKLRQAEIVATVQAAIERWRAIGISAEDLMRLQSLTFEIADLPDGQIATANSTNVKIDETAAGYGWYVDSAPMEDTEFDVAVPERELQTTEYSAAFGRMDLLTVVMRQMGAIYRQGKGTLPKQLLPLMQNTLSPAVRRLPDSGNIQLPRSRGRVSQTRQSGSSKSLVALPRKPLIPQTSPIRSRTAGFNPVAGTASRQTGRLLNHASKNRTMAAALNTMLADVMLSIGTLPAGESVTITFNVTVDDPFTGALPQVSNQGTVSGNNFADVLTDDPTVGGTADPTVTPIDVTAVSVAVSPTSVLEDGATNLVYTFTRNGSTANALTVNFSVGGTASFTEPDYTQTGAATFTATSGTVVIPSGSSTATVTVDPSVDLSVEPDETVVLTVTSGTGYTAASPSAATGTITNDDTSVSVAVSPGAVAEDGAPNLVYTFTRTGVISTPLAVDFTVGGTASFGVSPNDYTQTGATAFTSVAGVVTFTAGSSTTTVIVDPETDSIVEPDETVSLTVIAGVGYTPGAPASATGTITNDDTDVTLAVSPASVDEDGLPNLVYTFTRNGVTSSTLTVNFTVTGTAGFPADYSQTGATSFTPPTGTITFAAGSSTAALTIDPEADSTVEPDETVDITVTAGAGYNVGSPNAASGTITNDDTDVTLAVSPGSVAEDGATNLVYTFSRSGVTTSALTVNFTVAGSASFPADYSQTGATSFTPPTGTVTFAAGSSTAMITIDPVADSTVEGDETVDIALAAGAGYNVGSPNAASGTIVNDDTDVSIAVSPASVAEDGAANLIYTFTRNGVTSNALTVNFSVGGTASFGASPNDYTQTGATSFTPPTGTVTFAANATTATVIVDPVTDTTIEPDETVILTLTSGAGYNVSTPSSATGTISNDDADVSVAVAPASVAEDGATNLVYTFTRTGFTAGALTVNFAVGGTADFGPSPDDYTQTGATTYTTTSGSVTFAPGSPTATVTVDPEADITAEPDETVIITLAPGASYNAVSPSSATGTILNDDTLVSVVVAPSSTAEGGANLVYTFTRTGPTTSALTVNFSVGTGPGTASFPADYSQSGAATFAPPSATVTFGMGSSTATVTVTPLTDCTVEGNETVEFTVQPGTGYGVGSPNMATGTITNTPDSSAPTITLIPNVNMTLWPPNHQYESIAVTDFVASASDDCDPSVNVSSVYITQITSDEVENGNGDGNTLKDIIIGPSCTTAQLRAERAGNGNGRVYSITFKVKDSAGNFATATTTVTVRKSPNQPAVDSGTQYTVNSVCP